MIWVVLCKDKPNSLDQRMRIIDEHRAYLSTNPIKTLISGPLTDKEGNINGAFFMVEANSEEEIKIFQQNDPTLFFKGKNFKKGEKNGNIKKMTIRPN